MIAIVGASGQLGTAFVEQLGVSATPLTRTDFDVTDDETMRAVLVDLAPDAIINCAAFTGVDRAEDEPGAARAANAHAVGAMAGVAADLGVPFVTFSTDYVFDGTKGVPYVESDVPRPLNVYGKSKLEGEHRAAEAHEGALIVRTSWILSGTHPNFAATIIRKAREGPVRVVDDQFGRVTIADDLAEASLISLEAGVTGILHLANSPTVSWYELARECVALAGLDPDLVAPRPTVAGETRAMRPRNSALGSERLSELGLDPLPPYPTQLPEIIDRLERGTPG